MLVRVYTTSVMVFDIPEGNVVLKIFIIPAWHVPLPQQFFFVHERAKGKVTNFLIFSCFVTIKNFIVSSRRDLYIF